ncbi:MAG: hypothetical protein ACOY90_17780 [Candidatus Zhuqueibacterota bacterium]
MNQFGLNAGGWIFLIAAWGAILYFTFYCFYKVLFGKKNAEQSSEK